jgi:hypothetical protein
MTSKTSIEELREKLCIALANVTVKPHQNLNEAMADSVVPLIEAHTAQAVDSKMKEFGLRKGVRYKVFNSDKVTVLEAITNQSKEKV